MPVRVIDQPLAIKVIEQPKTEAQIDAEQKERADRAAFSDQLLILAALLVAVGAFLAIAFAVQVFYLGLGLRAMRRSCAEGRAQRHGDAARLRLRQRSDVERRRRQRPGSARSGRTPARRRPASFGSAPTGRRRTASCGPTSTSTMSGRRRTCSSDRAPRLSSARSSFRCAISRRRSNSACISMSGAAPPTTIMFEGTKPHFFEFCHRVEVAGETPDNMRLSFTQFGSSNGSDEDQPWQTADADQPSAASPRRSRAAALRMRLR